MIFPEISVIAKGNCREVEKAVRSIRDADALHWLHAYGLVDNDGRSQSDIEDLKNCGVYVTPVCSVEGLYYHPEVQRRVAKRHADTTGDDFDECVAKAKSAAIEAVNRHAEELSIRMAERLVRKELFHHIPAREQISAASESELRIPIDIPHIVKEERTRLQKAIEEGNLLAIVSRYPIHETRALDAIAQKLGFQNRRQYEGAVRKLLVSDNGALDFVRRELFGELVEALMSPTSN